MIVLCKVRQGNQLLLNFIKPGNLSLCYKDRAKQLLERGQALHPWVGDEVGWDEKQEQLK